MLKKIKVYPGGTAYLGKELGQEGYEGEVDALFNAVTITLLKPNVSLEDVKRSLEITIADVELRIKQEERGKQ